MKSIKKKYNCIAIMGPTASGKSELAVFLAKKIGGEIVSADSRQVYKHLDIGSNKVPGTSKLAQCSSIIKKRAMFAYKNIPHYCIDFVSPKKKFTVMEYKRCADAAIKDISNRGKVPILVGGTGFYMQAVIDNARIPEVEPNWQLRRKLEKKEPAELFRMLQKLDPRRAGAIDPKNPRRLIRAIEIVQSTNKPVPPLTSSYKTRSRFRRNIMVIGIKRGEKQLKERITKQVRRMLRRGLVDEVKKLREFGLSKKRIREFGFEYAYPLLYLDGEISERELEETLIKENWRYAKRQTTWWKKNQRITWISPHKSVVYSRLLGTGR